MAGSLNKVMIIGNLGKDPEVRRLNSGLPVVNFSVATSETWKDKATGERKDKTEWHNVVVFNEGLAKIAEQYLKKGSKVYIEGKLQTRKWQDQSGADRYTTEIVLPNFSGAIVLLGDKPGGDNQTKATPARANAYAEASGGTARQPSYAEELDDEIPF